MASERRREPGPNRSSNEEVPPTFADAGLIQAATSKSVTQAASPRSGAQNRIGIRRGRLFHLGVLRQLAGMHGKRRPDPDRIGLMVPARVGGIRMDQNAEIAVVEHQPRDQLGKYLAGKGHLVHGLIVRADLDVVPASERDREALA